MAAASEQSTSIPTDMVVISRQEWVDAYAAFSGEFDTPLSRRRNESEYAQDARQRLRKLNEEIVASPAVTVAGSTPSAIVASPTAERLLTVSVELLATLDAQIKAGMRWDPGTVEDFRRTIAQLRQAQPPYWERPGHALKLAIDRLKMLLDAELANSDHPGATRWVIATCQTALDTIEQESGA